LRIRIAAGTNLEVLIEDVLHRQVEACDQLAAGTSRGGSAMDLEYLVQIGPEITPAQIISAIHGIEGVQNVEFELAKDSDR
jgi:hypothetical protein